MIPVLAAVFALVGATAIGLFAAPDAILPVENARASAGPQVRNFTLDIVPTDLDMGGATWRAWSFNGTVPGPTLTASVGDTLRVTVVNNHNLTHSFHTHLVPASLASDGSQLNTITGIGGMAMIPPGESYTYELLAKEPGISYYHCHSADGGYTISQHMAQGLYGAILIKDPKDAPIRTEVVFMGERGFNVTDPTAPYFIMNGKGLPGGEHELERVFREQGAAGVIAQVGKTVPAFRGRVGEPIEVATINVGDAVHSFHLHGMSAYSQEQQPGRPVPAQVVQLVPGGVDRIRLTPTEPGLWLFHCHVVTHADQGMIGIFIVDPEEGDLDLSMNQAPRASAHDDGPSTGASSIHGGSHDAASAANGTERLEIVAGPQGAELTFTPDKLSVDGSQVLIDFANSGRAAHSLSFPALGVATGTVPSGGTRSLALSIPGPGSYEFICAEPGHAGAGMKGTMVVT